MNAIEHMWVRLKELIIEQHPELEQIGRTKNALIALEQAAKEAWASISDEYVSALTTSMQRRMAAVIAANGWYCEVLVTGSNSSCFSLNSNDDWASYYSLQLNSCSMQISPKSRWNQTSFLVQSPP